MHKQSFQFTSGQVATAIWQRLNTASTLKICIFLFVAALVLRVIGIHYGYWHGDERVNSAAKALSGQLIPGDHYYPPLHNYIVAVAYAVIFAVGRLLGMWHDTADFRSLYFSDPTIFYLSARFVTACMSALIAPLFFLVARELKFNVAISIVVAALAAILPVSVFLAHISKSDVPLATMTIATIYCLLLKDRDPKNYWLDIMLGLSVSLAFSFKHSFLFIAIPLGAWHAFRSIQVLERHELVKHWAVAGTVCVMSWLIFNIGIVLDFSNFLEYQAIQAQMSVRAPSSALSGVYVWGKLASHSAFGITAVSVLLFLAFPVFVLSKHSTIEAKSPLLAMWGAVGFAIVVVIAITGERQHEGLWIAHFTAMQLFAALLLAMLLCAPEITLRRLGAGLLAGVVFLSLMGNLRILREATAKPVAKAATVFLTEHYSNRKIVTSSQLNAPQRKAAQQWIIDREQRVAAKYGIEIPQRSDDNIIKSDTSGSLFVVNLPIGLHGMENATDEQMKGKVKPYAWPLQKEEWKLDYWLNQKFDLFVLADFDTLVRRREPKLFHEFYGEMSKRCTRVRRFEATKLMYLERPVVIFDCSKQKS